MGSRRRRHAALVCALCACGSDARPTVAAESPAEVAVVFAELQMREEQYKVDNASYLATAACSDPACAAWKPLNAMPPMPKLACSYTITAGTGGSATPPSGFTMTAPKGSWYFMVATCPEATFFASSTDVAIQRLAK